MKRSLTTAALAAGFILSSQAMASPMLWQNNSLTYLYGKNFAVDSAAGKEGDIQQTITFEHASGWSFGDLFFFTDLIKYNTDAKNGNGDGHTYYGEFSPRLSFGKIFQRDLSIGPIKDVLVAMTYEFGEGDVETYMIGPGFDLNVPGFD